MGHKHIVIITMVGVKVITNAAKESRHLLDIVSELKSVGTALSEFRDKVSSTLALTKGNLNNLCNGGGED